ncbi:carboxypeptidase-like regulatory domain-containing protein [Flavivirga algicola]|uniref:Carboxypeptidase-like regulatory domain-containing protein n=1 Tax=Flavivirga algicola TaxID=2729136 RepID=A0ABX1RTM5_9FLAO|nr:carboxypeptidase-like regulatory domain-containing protein [Flavivirga algicola]NMH86909.1 carboxypeptidase-like regulatory domain-containing protein [Flavivirga algicola]
MKKVLLVALFLFTTLVTFGQNTADGVVKNAQTNEPIPYINIGILNRDKGTVSNENGEFTLKIPNEFINDTIKISSIGYESRIFIANEFIKTLKENKNISLLEKVIELNEVVVSNKKLKEKVIGNKTKSKMMRGGFRNAELGNELGIKIKVKKSPIHLTKFHANVTSNTGEKMKFRLNLYDIEKGLPNNKLTNQNIIFSVDAKEGGFTLNLSEYNIIVEDDFFLTIELVENKGNKENEVFFSAGLLGNATVTRLTSQAEWKKLGSVGIGFSVTAEY